QSGQSLQRHRVGGRPGVRSGRRPRPGRPPVQRGRDDHGPEARADRGAQAVAVLAQFVLIVFALFAVLSLVVDVGYARLTQVQMQNAADSAAIEGLRSGRPAASSLAREIFDDDLDPANGDELQFGAGPVIDLNEGVTNLHALQTITVPDVPV